MGFGFQDMFQEFMADAAIAAGELVEACSTEMEVPGQKWMQNASWWQVVTDAAAYLANG